MTTDERIDALADEMRAGFKAMERRFDHLETKVDDLAHLVQSMASASGHSQRFDTIEERLDQISGSRPRTAARQSS